MEKVVRLGEVWYTKLGIGQITVLHGGYTDRPFQVRFAGSQFLWALDYDDLCWKIGG